MKSDSQVHITNADGTTSSAISYHMFVEKLVKKFTYDGQPRAEKELATRLEVCHTAIGVHTEAGEVADILKAYAIYGKPLDRDALVKELGDLRFWIMDIQNKFQIGDQEIVQGNADKLSTRYNKMTYSDKEAIARVDKKYVVATSLYQAADGKYLGGPFEHKLEAENFALGNLSLEPCVYVFHLDEIPALLTQAAVVKTAHAK